MEFFVNFGLYWGVPEGQNMSTNKDEEALYQDLKKSLRNLILSRPFLSRQKLDLLSRLRSNKQNLDYNSTICVCDYAFIYVYILS